MPTKRTDQVAADFWRLLNDGDPALADLFHENITLRPSGNSPWTGEFRGRDAVVTYLVELSMQFPDLTSDLIDTMTSETRITFLLDLRIERDGRCVEDRSAWLLEVRDGVIVDWELNDSDQYAMDAFWNSFPGSGQR
jgi:ketosteroid isomerase-like protein